MKSKVLVTGISGFVGSNLVRYFGDDKKFSIVSLCLRGQFSLSDFMGVTSVIHLAGKAHDLKSVANDAEYFKVNTELTKNIFDYFLQSDAKDFVYFSSVKAVKDSVEGILEEDLQPEPTTPYGKSKQLAEQYLLSKSLPVDKRLFILRPCMIHGPGNKGNLNLLYKFVEKKIPYPLAAFENKRSFLSIANLNYVINKILSDHVIPSGVYNLADDDPLSTNKVIEILGVGLGFKPVLWKVNPTLIRFIAYIGNRLHLPLNSERLKKLTESYVVSNRKLKNAFKIEKLPIDSEKGLLDTIKSFNN